MPLTPEEFEFLKRVYQDLDEKALEPGDPRYEAVYSHEGCEDPVDLLQTTIEFAETESISLFSGFRGSGKTTELHRLAKRLRDGGYTVLYADALEFVNPSQPIDISVLLVAIAGAFGEALAADGIDISGEAYPTRLWSWLTRTNVDLKEIGVKAGIDLKFELRNTPTFRQRLAEALSGRISDLYNDVTSFIEEGVKAIRKARGDDTRVVFLFDSLEQLRGSLADDEVLNSVERIFANYFKLLELPYVHVVYTVPPWLKFRLQGIKVRLLPCQRLWDRDKHRTKFLHGLSALRSLVQKRIGGDGLERLFGPNHKDIVDRLIQLSGGHFRDLILLLRETILRAHVLPVAATTIDSAITSVRSQFLPIAQDDAVWLAEIERERATPLQSRGAEDTNKLTFFLDNHVLLFLRNGEDWYDVHPLVRAEVARIAGAAQAAKQE